MEYAKTIKKSELLSKLGNIRRVSNLCSPRSYRAVPNQYCLDCENGEAFQSYDTLIAVRIGWDLYLTRDHDCSNTTSKYTKLFTGFDTNERRCGLRNGDFIFIEED